MNAPESFPIDDHIYDYNDITDTNNGVSAMKSSFAKLLKGAGSIASSKSTKGAFKKGSSFSSFKKYGKKAAENINN